MLLSHDKKKSNTNLRILLVEDDPIVQKAHRMSLERLGYKVGVAATGELALMMYEQKYQLIFLDYGLPDMAGIEVSKRIRQHEQQNGKAPIPIIMVTAYPIDDELKNECREAGINELVNKPLVSNKALQTLLQRWLSCR